MPQLALSAASFTASAAPAVAATAAKVGFMTTLKSVALNALMNVAITAAMSALQPQVGAAGRTNEWLLSPDGPIPFAAGRVGVAGSAVHIDTFGPDLMYKGFVTVLSGAGPIDGFESFRGDEEFVTFDASGKAITSQWKGEMWLKRSLGAQPDVALSSPVGLKHNAVLPGWGAASRLSGKACDMLILGENSKGSAYPTGEVKPLRVFRGLRVWDPRLDSTYPGGSGPCRLSDPSTWVYSANPGLWAIKWSLGLWEGPIGKGAPQLDRQVGGIGAKASGIEFETLVALANIADANGWTCAAYPTTDDDKSQVLDAFLQAAGAIYAQRAGKISCIQRAAPRTSIVTISAADTAGPLEIDTAASRIDRINTIRPRFWSEQHRWQLTALPEVTAAAYREQDTGTRPRGIDFPFVTNAKQAAQLAALQIANTREGIAGVIPLKPHLQRIRPGDAFTIMEPGFVLDGVKCLCLNTDYDPATGIVRVSFVSETDAKYPFAMGQSPVVPVPPVLTPVDPTHVSPPLPEDWTIVVRPPAPDGTQVPGFDLSGDVSNATADSMLVYWREVASGEDPATEPPFMDEDGVILPGWVDAGIWPPTTRTLSVQGPQPGSVVWLAIRYKRGNNVSAPAFAGPKTTPGLIAKPPTSDPIPPDAPGDFNLGGSPGLGAGGEPVFRMRATWAAAENADHYEVEVTAGGETVVYGAPSTSYEWLSVIGLNYSARVRSVGRFGSRSAWSVLKTLAAPGDTVAPAAPSGLDTSVSVGAWTVKGVAPGDLDLKRVELWSHTSNDVSSAVKIDERTPGPSQPFSFTISGAANQSRWFWGKSVDTSENGSDLVAAGSGALPAIPTGDIDTTPPAPPTGLTRGTSVVIDAATGLPISQVTVSWDANSEPDLGSYELEVSINGGPPQTIDCGDKTTKTISPALGGASYIFRLVALDRVHNRSLPTSPTAPIIAANDGVAPAVPTGLGHTVSPMAGLSLHCTAPADADLAKIEFFENTSNNFATAYRIGAPNAQPGQLVRWPRTGLKANERRWFWCVATDSSRNASVQAGPIDVTVPYASDTDFMVGSLSASILRGGTGLDGSILVGDTGVTIGSVQGQAQTAAADAATALNTLGRIQSDAWLSRDEKPEVMRQWGAIGAEYPDTAAMGATLGLTALRTAYVNAYNALSSYLTGLSPAYNDLSADTAIVAATFTARFNDYFTARQALLNGGIGLDPAGRINAGVTLINGGLVRISGPGSPPVSSWVAPDLTSIDGGRMYNNSLFSEKMVLSARGVWMDGVRFEPNAVNGSGVSVANQVRSTAGFVNWIDDSGTPQRTAVSSSLTAVITSFPTYFYWTKGGSTIESTTSRAFAMAANRIVVATYNGGFDLTTPAQAVFGPDQLQIDSVLTRHVGAGQVVSQHVQSGTFTGREFSTTAALPASITVGPGGATLGTIQGQASSAAANAGQAMDRINAIQNDNILSRDEKPEIIRQWGAIFAEKTGTSNMASLLGLTTPLATYNAAYTALSSYLTSLTPAWNDTSQDSPIVAATLLTRFTDYYSAKQAILNAAASVDPANRINTGSTLILPGHVGIYGATTLFDWMAGPNSTEINGGKLATGSVDGTKATFGVRGVSFAGLDFKTDGNTLSWSLGELLWSNNAGVGVRNQVSAGSAVYAGAAVFLYVDQPTGTGPVSLSTTTNMAAVDSTRVLVGAYYGGTNFQGIFGRTQIDGWMVRLGALTAAHMTVGELSAISANIGDITAGKIGNAAGTTFFDLTNGRQQFQVGSYVWRQGSIGSNVVTWFGPSSIPIGSETRTNGAFATGTDGQTYLGNAPLQNGGGDLTVDSNIGQTKGGRGYNMIAGSSWQNLSSVTLTGVTAGEMIVASQEWDIVSTSGGTFVGEWRLLDGATVIAGPEAFSLFDAAPNDPLFLNAFAAASGSRTYALQARQTSGGYLNSRATGPYSYARMASATSASAGLMSADQASKLDTLWNAGGGVSLATSAPMTIGASNAVGTGTTAARADHVHAHGNQAGGGLHALATTSAHGFMPSTDKAKLDGMTPNTAAVNNTLLQRTTVSGNAGSGNLTDLMVSRASDQGAIFFGSTSHWLFRTASKFSFTLAVEAPSFPISSDLALKDNLAIEPDDQQAVATLCQIARAEWDSREDGVHRMGVVAQALADLDPRLTLGGEVIGPLGALPVLEMDGDEDGDAPGYAIWDAANDVWRNGFDAVWDPEITAYRRPLKVDPMALLSSAIAAIRVLVNENGALESRVSALDAALTARIEALENLN